MNKFTKGHVFVEDEQITHEKLNNLVDSASFASAAVDGTTTDLSSGAIIVATGGITVAQLADNAVEEAKIKNLNVTTGKIANDAINADKIADNAIQAEHYSDGSISEEHLNNNVISGQAALNATPSLTDTVLISDADDSGNLKKLELMKHLPLPKCYGNVTYTSSTPAVVAGAYNVASVSEVDSKGRRIDFTTNMADSNYVVIAGVTGPGFERNFYTTYVVSKAPDHFILSNDADENSGRELSFVVFGNLA